MKTEATLPAPPDAHPADGSGRQVFANRLDDHDDPRSLGLIGLHERAQMLGGRISISSGDNAGVCIAVTFPARALP